MTCSALLLWEALSISHWLHNTELVLLAQVTAATAALKPAVALCQRHSRDASPEVTQQLWLNILQGYVTLLRELRTHPDAKPLQQPEGKRALSTLKALAWPSGTPHL